MSQVIAPAAAPRVGVRLWVTVGVLGLVGQLAWTVENMYLNVFVYDTLTDDPTVLAALVAASAVSATVATMLVGTLSDRWGRRRALIAGGYVVWGLITATFGLITVDRAETLAVGSAVAIAVTAVIVLDCVMSFIGSGANDAAFQAWITDSTTPATRGRVDALLATMPLLAMLVVFGALDGLTQAGRWTAFFAIVGLTTAGVGVLAWFLVRDAEGLVPRREPYLRAVVEGLRPAAVRARPTLYTALALWAVVGTCTQVFVPYLIIYIQRYLAIDAYPLVLAVVLVTASVVSVLGGRVMDRLGAVRLLPGALVVLVAGLVAMFVTRTTVPVTIAGTVMMSGFMLTVAGVSATVRNHTPEGRAGSVQGLRMVFAILVPMVVGPFIGAAVIAGVDETYVDLGVTKQVPSPWIFLAAAAVLVLAVPLLARLRRTEVTA